jgi:hypothetical protein
MAKNRMLVVTPPGGPNLVVEEGDAAGDRNDIRTYKAPRAKVYASAESSDLSAVPGLLRPFMGEVGLPGACTSGRLRSDADTMSLEYPREVFNDNPAKHAAKAREVAESLRRVIAEDHERRY